MGNWMTCIRSPNQATNALIEKVYKSAVAALNGTMAGTCQCREVTQAMVFLPRARSCPSRTAQSRYFGRSVERPRTTSRPSLIS